MFFNKNREDYGLIGTMIENHVASEYYNIMGNVVPDLLWDTACIREKADVFYRFYSIAESKIIHLSVGAVPEFLSDYSLISLALPSDRCITKLYNMFVGEESTEEEVLKNIVAQDLDACEYSTMRVLEVNGYTTNLVSFFNQSIKTAYEELLDIFLTNGGSVVSVTDRIFYMSIFLSNEINIPPGSTCMCIERRGDTYTIWNLTNLEGTIVPVNSISIRLEESDAEDYLFKHISFLINESSRIHKMPLPTILSLVDAGGEENVITRAQTVDCVMRSVPTINNQKYVFETTDSVLLGMIRERGDV